jgi:hypothetical protein
MIGREIVELAALEALPLLVILANSCRCLLARQLGHKY